MKNYDESETWDMLINWGIATEEELELVTDIDGYNMDTLNAVIYARTALNDIEQLAEDMGEDMDEDE